MRRTQADARQGQDRAAGNGLLTISYEEPCAGAIRQVVLMALAGVHYALQLQAAEGAILYLILQAELVCHVGRLHSRQTGSLDHGIWMLLSI